MLDVVVGQVQPLDGRRLLEDGLAEAADAVAGQPEAVEGVEAGERRGMYLRDLVLAQVEGAQRRPQVAQRGVRDVAEEVGVETEVLQDGAAVLEDVPEKKRWRGNLSLGPVCHFCLRTKIVAMYYSQENCPLE